MGKTIRGTLGASLSGLLALAVALPGAAVAEDSAEGDPKFFELDELPTVVAAPVAVVALVGGITGGMVGHAIDTALLAPGVAIYAVGYTVAPLGVVMAEGGQMVWDGVIGVSPRASEWGAFRWPRGELFKISPDLSRGGERLGQIVTAPYGAVVLGIDDAVAYVSSAF